MEERFETFTVLIARISRSIKRIKAEEMADFELKGPHVSCLYYLSQQDSMTASELCERCDEDKAAISRSLDDLEKNGYITCASGAGRRYKSPQRRRGEDHTHRRSRERGPERGRAADDVPRAHARQRKSGSYLHTQKNGQRQSRAELKRRRK